jgi:glycerol-3-phosphate acyltransferase PlsY
MVIVYLSFSLALGYLIGSIPTGYLMVRILKGEDIRKRGSGRTGGTNVGRALGTWAGVLTAILDGVKAAVVVAIVKLWFSDTGSIPSSTWLAYWPEALAGIGAVVGHNWPLFLSFQGGAGTMASVGAATMLWWFALPIEAVTGGTTLFLTSYASAGSIVAAISLTVAFVVRAILGAGPWAYAFYGGVTTCIVLWALRPNIRRIQAGTEREIRFGLKYLASSKA